MKDVRPGVRARVPGRRHGADVACTPNAGEPSVTLTYGGGRAVMGKLGKRVRRIDEQPADFPTAAGPARMGNR